MMNHNDQPCLIIINHSQSASTSALTLNPWWKLLSRRAWPLLTSKIATTSCWRRAAVVKGEAVDQGVLVVATMG